MSDDASLEGLTPAQREQLRVGATLLSNPEIRRDVQRLYKRANPKAVIPELEAEEQIAAARAETDKRLEKIEEQNMELRVQARRRERDEQARAAGFEPADVEAIVVREKCSYETALKIAALEARTAEPTASDIRNGNAPNSPIDMRPGEDWRKIGQNTGALRRKSAEVASEVIKEFRQGRRAQAR